MNRFVSASIFLTLVMALSACGKDEAPVTKTTAPQPAKTEAPASTNVASTTKQAEPAKDISYRPVNAKLRLSGESIVIMVPDDMDIESGSMLEYREAADGTYYLKSVIPK